MSDTVDMFRAFPRWAQAAIAGVAVLCVAAYPVYYWRDHLRSDSQKISPADFVQLSESSKHLVEEPEERLTVYRDARGALEVLAYKSDGCLLVKRTTTDPAAPVYTRFIQDFTRQPPGKALGGLTPPVAELAPTAALESAAWAQGPGMCIPPERHPQPRVEQRALDQCWIETTFYFPDGCVGRNHFNVCGSFWGAFVWLRCVH